MSVLLYHIVCPAKCRRVVFSEEVDNTIRDICLETAKRYEIQFLEIGTDRDHGHFLVQSVPTYSLTKIVRTMKSITARETFGGIPSVKKELWGGGFWTDGFFVNTVGRSGSENAVRQYVREHGKEREYKQLHQQQLILF